MKILYGYLQSEGYNQRYNITDKTISYLNRLNDAGFEVKPFCMNYSADRPMLPFHYLNKLWKFKDYNLLNLYNRFLHECEDCDVFYNSVGVNFHPEFVSKLNIITVFGCNDDPESSSILSKPVAFAYDMCAVGNIAELNTYKSWGCKNVFWQPMGIWDNKFEPSLTRNDILTKDRDIDLFMMIDRLSPYRKKRCSSIAQAFPDGHFYGRGWSRGYLPQDKEVGMLQRSKIGINIHNSTGPINVRLFYLPANGVLQICDNKSNLGKIFDINKEVVGFDTIDECIEKCHYYLRHIDEARQIAANGWLRVHKDYNEIAVFQKLIDNINIYCCEKDITASEINILKEPDIFDKTQGYFYKKYIDVRRCLALKLKK